MGLSIKRYVIEKEYHLSREQVWTILSDTDRINRIIGLFPVQFSPVKKSKGDYFYRAAHAKVAGMIPISWNEYPFQWEENNNYSVERYYQSGPIKHFYGGVELSDTYDPSDGRVTGTKVRLFAEFTPQNVLGMVVIPLTGYKSMVNTLKYIDNILKTNNKDKEAHISLTSSSKPKINENELHRLFNNLEQMPVNPELLKHLEEQLVKLDDHDVVNMNPITIANGWGVNEKQTLRLFLYATKVGILNLSWTLICPNCRVSKAEYSSLSNIENTFHCDLCGINYDANFENYVELNFSVHPNIRKAYADTYCIGGPMITPHVKAQKLIKQGERLQLPIPHSEEPLRLRVLQANHILTIHKEMTDKNEEGIINYSGNEWSVPSISLGSKPVPITIQNSSSDDIILVLEQSEWRKQVVTAGKVTAMQEFRDLFSSEVLAPGKQVGIENITILFSDLQGSTTLYETIGDANAYGQVRRHFDFLTHWISENSGSVVKTIGDAVMAVFYKPEDSIKAAIQIQKHVSEFNKIHHNRLVLKLGIYSGPAIVVNSNDQLDYFGRTVNIAARIQGKSVGNDIVFDHDYLNDQTIISLLQREDLEAVPFKTNLKGIEGHFDLVRLNLK